MYYHLFTGFSTPETGRHANYPRYAGQTLAEAQQKLADEAEWIESLCAGECAYVEPQRFEGNHGRYTFYAELQKVFTPIMMRLHTEPRVGTVTLHEFEDDAETVAVTVHRTWRIDREDAPGAKYVGFATTDKPVDPCALEMEEIAELAMVADISPYRYSNGPGRRYEEFPTVSRRFGGLLIEKVVGLDV